MNWLAGQKMAGRPENLNESNPPPPHLQPRIRLASTGRLWTQIAKADPALVEAMGGVGVGGPENLHFLRFLQH